MMTEYVSSSGSLAVGTTVVCSTPGALNSVSLNPGSAASSVIVYDNATAGSGTALYTLVGPASGSSVVISFDSPIFTKNGLTVVVAGTAATATLTFTKSA